MKTASFIRIAPLAALLTLPVLSATGCATGDAGSIDSAGDSSSQVGVRASIELSTNSDGQYYFDVTAGNGEVLLWSENYTGRTGALNGLLSVLDNGGIESRYTVTEGKDGKFYLGLKAANGQTIAQGEGYATASSAKRAIGTCANALNNYLQHWNSRVGARFEIFQGKDGRYYFRLFGKNGAQVLHSQGYSSKASALNGAFGVADYGLDAAAYDVKETASGYYFNVRAPNNQIIATSEVYSTKSNATRACDGIMALLPDIDLL